MFLCESLLHVQNQQYLINRYFFGSGTGKSCDCDLIAVDYYFFILLLVVQSKQFVKEKYLATKEHPLGKVTRFGVFFCLSNILSLTISSVAVSFSFTSK